MFERGELNGTRNVGEGRPAKGPHVLIVSTQTATLVDTSKYDKRVAINTNFSEEAERETRLATGATE
jgi:hypothetical protein